MNNNIYIDENICSKIWLNPIKGNRDGVQKIGLEMEMFAYHKNSLLPFGLEDSKINIQTLFSRIAKNAPNSALNYDKNSELIIGVSLDNGANFSAEPGGQIEFSSAPVEKISCLIENVAEGLKMLETASENELVFLSHGTNPIAARDHPLLLPKERYKIMTRYFNSAPQYRGIDMMRHSATVQANLDIFGSENWEDAVNLILVLIPLTTLLFANSRYFKGERSRVFSERQEIWKNMDPTRSGFVENMAFSDNIECTYAKWARRANVFLVDAVPFEKQPLFGELSFNDWLLNGYSGLKPTLADWEGHLGTLFPHLRLRDFLEIRHIDAQPFEHTLAPVVFFSALVQSKKVRTALWEFLKRNEIDFKTVFSVNETEFLHMHVPLLDFAAEILEHSKETEAKNAILAYKKFLSEKETYWAAKSAQAFVENRKTSSPSSDFQKYIS